MSFPDLLAQWVSGTSVWNEGAAVVLALGLMVVARTLMPAHERHRLRLAIVLLLFHLSVLVPAPFLGDGPQHWARLVALFLLLASLARASFLLVMDGIVERRTGRSIPQIFRDLLQVTLFVFAGLVTLAQAGVDLSSLLATSALITAVVGLSLQETLGNTIAGLAMQAQPPFAVGDWIEVDGRVGQVTSVGWRSIAIWTNDDVEISVPNGMLAKGVVVNYSRPSPTIRRTVHVSAPYAEPPHHVEAVLLDAIVGVPGVLQDPPPLVVTGLFGESGIDYELRFFINDFRARDVLDSLVRDRVWYAFRRASIKIPYPTQDVFLHTPVDAKANENADERVAERISALTRVDFLAELPAQALRDLALGARRKPYGVGEIILQQGDPGEEFFVIRRGEVGVMLGDKEVARLSAGGFFGEMSLMTGAPRAATVQALSPCELVVVNKPSMQEVLETYPLVLERITAALSARLVSVADMSEPDAGADVADTEPAMVRRIRDFFKLA